MNKHKLPNIQPLSNAVTALAKKNWIPDCHRDAQYHSRAKKWKNFPEWQTLYHRFFYCILVLNEKSSDNIGIVIPKRQLEWGLLVLLLWTVLFTAGLDSSWILNPRPAIGTHSHHRSQESTCKWPTTLLRASRMNGPVLASLNTWWTEQTYTNRLKANGRFLGDLSAAIECSGGLRTSGAILAISP